MNKKNIPFIVQLKQNNNKIITGINQNDLGVLFDLKVMDGLEPFDFSGYGLVTLKIKKPDGTFTYDSNLGDNVDIIDPVHGRLKLNLLPSCTAQKGMHFCAVNFSLDVDTVFETLTFNYFVGENPNADDDDVKGENEFPVIGQIIASAADMQTNETARNEAELMRQEAEQTRNTSYESLMDEFENKLQILDDRVADAYLLLQETLQALADGGSVDVSQLSALASKTWVNGQLSDLNYADQTKKLRIYHGDGNNLRTLDVGELYYNEETKELLTGDRLGYNIRINEPCFVVSGDEPTDTTKLWIDISQGVPCIKYFDDEDWVSCNTAVFG
jgi:hypothetical protein